MNWLGEGIQHTVLALFFYCGTVVDKNADKIGQGYLAFSKTLTHIKALLIVSETKWCFTSTCLLLTT